MNTAGRLLVAQPEATKEELIDTAITLWGQVQKELDGTESIKFPDGSSIKFCSRDTVKTWGMVND